MKNTIERTYIYQIVKTMKSIIPKTWTHNRELTVEGFGSHNVKEYCKCDNCVELRLRRDNIYKSNLIGKILKILNKGVKV